MSKQTRQYKFLENINIIGEEFSEISEDEFSENEDILVANRNEFDSIDTDDEEENIVNVCSGRKRIRLLSSSEESEVEINEQNVANDGSVWQQMQVGGTPGRAPLHNIFRQEVGPTGYAKRHIMKGKVSTGFSLIIDHRIMNHIRTCTIEEAKRVLGSDWSLSKKKLDAFIAILYARAAYGGNNLNISFLWNNIWGPKFFSETMSRNNFTEILRFIRFDKKSQRSQRLKTDKFAMVIYKSKPTKKVLSLSSKHKFVKVENNDKRLPETVSYYNKTKFGVDMTDQMARKFTTKSKSCRWPLQVFFNILDLAGINAWILYKQTTGENISRQDFLLKLAEELGADFREAREQPKQETNTKGSLPKSTTDAYKRMRCQIGYCKENKTNKICSKCKKYVCGKCTMDTLICKKCDEL